jgi:hypothetical protein
MSPLVVIRLHHRNLQYLQEANADVYTVARFDLNFEHFSISSDLLGSGDCLLEFDFKFPHETLEELPNRCCRPSLLGKCPELHMAGHSGNVA